MFYPSYQETIITVRLKCFPSEKNLCYKQKTRK